MKDIKEKKKRDSREISDEVLEKTFGGEAPRKNTVK